MLLDLQTQNLPSDCFSRLSHRTRFCWQYLGQLATYVRTQLVVHVERTSRCYRLTSPEEREENSRVLWAFYTSQVLLYVVLRTYGDILQRKDIIECWHFTQAGCLYETLCTLFQVWTFCTSRVFLGNVMYMWVDYSLLFAFVFLLFGIRGVGILLWLDIPGEYMSVNCLLFVFAFLLFSIFEVLYTCGLIIIHCCLCLYSYIYYSKCGHFTQLGS